MDAAAAMAASAAARVVALLSAERIIWWIDLARSSGLSPPVFRLLPNNYTNREPQRFSPFPPELRNGDGEALRRATVLAAAQEDYSPAVSSRGLSRRLSVEFASS